MSADRLIWPTFEALSAQWASPLGAALEVQKTQAVAQLLRPHLPNRLRALIIGPASPTLCAALQVPDPHRMFQAYPPSIGARHGAFPALQMDSDLPPFARAEFDFVLLSHALEFRRMPLALLSLVYEVLNPQGHMAAFVPHQFTAERLCPGYGRKYFGAGLAHQLRSAALTPVGIRALHTGARLSLGGVRPAGLVALARPQVPPRPHGGGPVPRLWPNFRPGKALGGVASTQDLGQEQGHGKT